MEVQDRIQFIKKFSKSTVKISAYQLAKINSSIQLFKTFGKLAHIQRFRTSMQVLGKFSIQRKVLICKIITNMHIMELVYLKVHRLEHSIYQQIMELNIEGYE